MIYALSSCRSFNESRSRRVATKRYFFTVPSEQSSIVTNVCMTHRQRRRNRLTRSLDSESDGEEHTLSDTVAGDSTADGMALENEVADSVERALQKLSPAQRMVFTLRHYQNYKLKEIATMRKSQVAKLLWNLKRGSPR